MDGVNPNNLAGASNKPAARIPDAGSTESVPTMARDGYIGKARPAPLPAPKTAKTSTLDRLAKVIGPVGFAAGLICIGLGLFAGMGMTMALIGAGGAISSMGLMMRR